ncbi:glycoside hydrolase family 28 protein [Puteibacter caeruleilacunae]|nr:glycoside hydrolase family 28 protein [Puteibacter caeruleilacunae]
MKCYFLLMILCCSFSVWTKAEKTEIVKEKTPWGVEEFAIPQFSSKTFSIVRYGAKQQKSNNQKAIQKAIDACHKAGGGTVVIPNGKWMTSYLEMKSNVNLFLEDEANLTFLNDIKLYAVPTFTRWEGFECMNYHPLIYARNCTNVAITGKGKIDGNGSTWWFMKKKQHLTLPILYDQLLNDVAPEDRNCLDMPDGSMLRPALIQFIGCKNVLLRDFEVTSGPMWTVHMVYGHNVIAQKIRVITTGSNNDGIIPDSCEKMLIDDCYFSTGDDCIVIKSGLNEDGWRVGKPSTRIVIKNCETEHGHGGVVIGSEMSGGVNHVYAHDCNFSNTDRGLRIKSRIGRGGVIENIWFENITMNNIKNEAIKLNMHYGASSITPKSDKKPVFRNFHFKNIHSKGSKYGVHMKGIEDQLIEDIHFENMELSGRFGIYMANASKCSMTNVTVHATEKAPVVIENSTGLSFTGFKTEEK